MFLHRRRCTAMNGKLPVEAGQAESEQTASDEARLRTITPSAMMTSLVWTGSNAARSSCSSTDRDVAEFLSG